MKNLLLSLVVAAALSSTAARATTLTVTSTADDGTTAGTLRSLLAGAADGDTIDFSVTGTITLISGELLVDKNVTIMGPGAANLAVDGNAAGRVFHIGSGKTVAISDLTITNGNAWGPGFWDPVGGGIYNDHATLTVSRCTLSGNLASSAGGAISNDGVDGNPTLTASASTLSGNSAGQVGGAIHNEGYGGRIATVEIGDTILNVGGGSGGTIYNNNFG